MVYIPQPYWKLWFWWGKVSFHCPKTEFLLLQFFCSFWWLFVHLNHRDSVKWWLIVCRLVITVRNQDYKGAVFTCLTLSWYCIVKYAEKINNWGCCCYQFLPSARFTTATKPVWNIWIHHNSSNVQLLQLSVVWYFCGFRNHCQRFDTTVLFAICYFVWWNKIVLKFFIFTTKNSNLN